MDQKILQVVEKIGIFYENQGMPLSAGRVLGLLLVAEEPVTLEEIAEMLDISKASVSLATRLLENGGLLTRMTLRGERKIRYQMSVGMWPEMFRKKMAAFGYMSTLAKEGLAVLPPDAKRARSNLEEMDEFFGFMIVEIDKMLAKWQDIQESR